MNKRERPNKIRKVSFVTIVVLLSCTVGPRLVSCQKNKNAGGGGSAAGSAGAEIFTQTLYKSMSNYTSVFKGAIKKELGYCITDV